MPGTLSKLTKRLMGGRVGGAGETSGDETEVLESSALRSKIGYLTAMELFRDFTLSRWKKSFAQRRCRPASRGAFSTRRMRRARCFYSQERRGADLSYVAGRT
jgi:hypothetical protein